VTVVLGAVPSCLVPSAAHSPKAMCSNDCVQWVTPLHAILAFVIAKETFESSKKN
jgi:hypothetical protein